MELFLDWVVLLIVMVCFLCNASVYRDMVCKDQSKNTTDAQFVATVILGVLMLVMIIKIVVMMVRGVVGVEL